MGHRVVELIRIECIFTTGNLMYVFIFMMLQISTYNCQSSNRNAGGIHKLCESSDIVFLQEHWLFPADLPSLNTIHSDFSSAFRQWIHRPVS